jgi:hypothetical protein
MTLLLTDTGYDEVKQFVWKELRVTAFHNWHSIVDRRKGELERLRKRWRDQYYLRIYTDIHIMFNHT